LHFLQGLFSLGGNKQPAQPAKKNRPSHGPKRKPPTKALRKRSLRITSRRRSLLRAISPQRRSAPSRSLRPSLRPRLLPHQPKPRGKLLHTNGQPPIGRGRVPRRRPRLPFTPLPHPRSLRGRLSQARSRQSRLLDLQRLQARRRPRTCLRQSATRESQAPKRRAWLLRTGLLPPTMFVGQQSEPYSRSKG